jgi:hypothetical protein
MRLLSAVLGVLALGAAQAAAQQNLPPLPQPRLQSLFPGGARAGTTVEVTFAGTDIDEPEALYFSHPGLQAEPIQPPEPPADPKKPMPQPAKPKGMRGRTVVTKFKVTVSPGTPLGLHDVRLVNRWGVSNPRPFAVGDLPEVEEKEPNNDEFQAQKVQLNCVVNGVINTPTDVDYFSFPGKKGQRVLLHVAASSLDSRARPEVQLYGPGGAWLVTNRNYHNADALADAILPADGDYIVRLYEFTHTAGGTDYYYRLTITTGPWIDAVMPPMIEPGKTAQVTVYGRNLPGGQPVPGAFVDGHTVEKVTASITAPSDPLALQRLALSDRIQPRSSGLDGFEYRIQGSAGWSNPCLIQFARAPVILEKEPNDKPEAPQEVQVPCEIAGRLDHRSDRDWYAFAAKKGDVFMIELFGDRIGTPADFYFSVRPADAKASSMGEFDDNRETISAFQFNTGTTDPQPYRFEAKQDGRYLIRVSALDAGTEFGPRHLYRLRVTPEQPDFRLIVMPNTAQLPEAGILPAGGELSYDVLVWRQDGFSAPITLTAEGLPAGVVCPPQRIGPGQKQATLVLSAAAGAAPAVAAITVKGSAVVAGKQLLREARSATISWPLAQPNIVAISRVDRQLVLAVRDKPPYRVSAKETALAIKQGDKATLNFQVARLWPDFKGPIQVGGFPGPQQNQPLIPGVQFNNNQPITIAPDKTDGSGVLNISNNAVPGVYSFVLRGSAQHQYEKVAKGPKVNTGLAYPALPVTLTIVPSSLGSLSASAGNLKVGAVGDLTIKVSRSNGYTGEYKLKLVVPAGVKGISAADASIPAGQNEARLKVQIAPDVKPGGVPNLVVQAVAMFEEKTPVVSETKFNLNVVK